ncbi:hypothetical protein IFR05_016795 [Cadophora sp. M221]|nr:hypothetical protein IFR05_016795 [Cadophora sp. M221]
MKAFASITLLGFLSAQVLGQDTLGLGNGYLRFSTPDLDIDLVKTSQTLASIRPKLNPTFDFSPFDFLPQRATNGNYHVGDITARYRIVGSTPWIGLDSASARAPVTLRTAPAGTFAASFLAPTIANDAVLGITRQWGSDGGSLTLEFTIANKDNSPVEIGALGFPIEFNSIFSTRSPEATLAKCSIQDPNIGLNAGYVQVTPLSGTGPALVVTPLNNTSFEAWRFLSEAENTRLGYHSQTFEGFYSWEVLTKAYAQNEWNSTTPWNTPTSKILQPGQSVSYGLKFSVSPSIQAIEDTVAAQNIPVAIGIPGYVVPSDSYSTLFLKYSSAVSSITSTPARAFTFVAVNPTTYKLTPAANAWGRVRVNIVYADNRKQSVSYFVTKSGPQTIADLGNFLTTTQYYTDTHDPFDRAPSIMGWDRFTSQFVTQDGRVWMAGLSDEGGAGSWLAAVMKISAQPKAAEVAKLEDFIHQTVLGTLSPPNSLGVRNSVFYYQPSTISYPYSPATDWGTWTSFDLPRAYNVNRAYNYVHVTAAYWALYRIARSYPTLVTQSSWQWYLTQAHGTVMYCFTSGRTIWGEFGLMGETVWGELLQDLTNEGFTTEAASLSEVMQRRAAHWSGQAAPFGSEQAWDSTGQEGVYYWTNHFGFTATATKAINSILGYMPTVSHWGWNGNARRYWDFIYGAKLKRFERMIHHYGSGLNGIALLAHFEANPTDVHALRVGYGGNSGPLSNIDQAGFASAAFHSWPDTMAWDSFSGDYGPGFVGHILGGGCYVVNDPALGLLAFGGEIMTNADGNGGIMVTTKDSVRRKVYLAMYGLSISVDSGNIVALTYWPATKYLAVGVVPSISGVTGMATTNQTILRITKKAQVGTFGTPVLATASAGFGTARGGYLINWPTSSGTSVYFNL